MRRELAILNAGVRVVRTPTLAGVVFLAATILGGAGCSSRQHSNPLDPANGQTAGRPAGFAAVAFSNQVLLRWTPTDLGTQIFRKSDTDTAYQAITPPLPARTASFLDFNAPNGLTYHYRLAFVTRQGLSPPSTADATPSRVIAYTADGNLTSVLRLGADGREVATAQPGFGQATYLAIDRERELLWVANIDEGIVSIYNPTVGSKVAIRAFLSPHVVAIDPTDGSAWITDTDQNQVWHYRSGGDLGTPASIDNLEEPIGVDVDSARRVLWVCEKRGGRMRRFSTVDGSVLGQVVLTRPQRVAIDSANGEAWITSLDSAHLYHVSPSGAVLDTVVGFSGPVGVAVDPRRGRIWVADQAASQVIAFRRDGSEELRVSGLPGAREVAVELASGEAWVTLGSTIARVSPAGAVLTITRGLSAPSNVALDLLAR